MPEAGQEFSPSVPRSEPLTTKGHQVGQKVGNDAAPEFHAQVLPSGSAPKKDTHEPNPSADSTGTGELAPASAADTITGSTSGDVHTGLGHPGSGQASQEKHASAAGSGSLEGLGDRGLAMAGGAKEGAEAKALKSEHEAGPKAASSDHNATVSGSAD